MTDLYTARADSRPAWQAAARSAERAAHASGVRVRLLTGLEELRDVYRLFDGIWRPDPANPPVTSELLRALTKGGNYVSGAYEGDRLVGASVGFFGVPADRSLHSHIAGVAPPAHGRSIGFALKLHQRAWALQQGAGAITWTYDPLVSRNAHFNLMKLSATAVEYLRNFYGGMHDGINGDDESDRLLIHWDLGSPEVTAAGAGTPRRVDAVLARGAVTALARSGDGLPAEGTLDGEVLLVAVPEDIETLRRDRPEHAARWRKAVRGALETLLADGARVVGFSREAGYVVTRGTNGEDTR
ncbi:GNAT family N-acetyltransferase [Streptomyces sp. NPDC001675]